jgi:hypothetical protein
LLTGKVPGRGLGSPVGVPENTWTVRGKEAPTFANPDAARIIGRAVDAELPRLREAVSTLQPSPSLGFEVDGCDVLDALPELCVGGTDNNRYREDAALLIDLGGNDTYNNSAGGADPVDGNDLDVSIVIDVAGDDRYSARLPLPSGSRVSQGAGIGGGIGMLIDAEGDDTYAAAAASKPGSLGTIAQGAGAVQGIGVLADLGGSDSYELTGHGRPRKGVIVPHLSLGQGGGYSSGLGILLDSLGDDSYSIRETLSQRGELLKARAFAIGLGAGYLGGAGIFADQDGIDERSITSAHVSNAAPSRAKGGPLPQGPGVASLSWSDAGAYAFGLGAGVSVGTGIAITGPHDSKSQLNARTNLPVTGEPPTVNGTLGFNVIAMSVGFGAAMGSTGGFSAAGLLDSGGDDKYEITSVGSSRADFDYAGSFSHGLGVLGVGVIDDAGGDDSYLSSAKGTGLVPMAEAIGQGSGVQGAGILLDKDGDDKYRLDSQSLTEGTPIGGLSQTHRPIGGRTVSAGQGSGFLGVGILVDHAGVDIYRSDARSFSGYPANFSQASIAHGPAFPGVAMLHDLGDGGTSDRFLSYPENRPCEGIRGGEEWVDCGGATGRGKNT